jgi:hypothetical protein
LLGGVKTWVRLPRERWPKAWEKFHDPVVPLRLALYGHPDAGGYWEKHCEAHILKVGFVTIKDWRSVYWHPDLKLLLIVYVDDFKMSGPVDLVEKGWRLLRTALVIEDPSPAGKFLGCTNVEYTLEVPEPFNCLALTGEGGTENAPTGKTVTVKMVKYDQKDFLEQCVNRYLELAQKDAPSLRYAETPFIDTKSQKALEEVIMRVMKKHQIGALDLKASNGRLLYKKRQSKGPLSQKSLHDILAEHLKSDEAADKAVKFIDEKRGVKTMETLTFEKL